MFTGLIEAMGRVARTTPDGAGGKRLTLTAPFADQLTVGESVAVSGACLTVVIRDDAGFEVQVSPETLQKTTLGELAAGDAVNLERSLKFGERLGGHLVQGHVDGIGQVAERRTQGGWEMMRFNAPRELMASMVSKGSVAVDGVSLTLVDVTPERFSVALIPHTLAATTLGTKKAGATVNLETDIIGKYVAKWMENLKS